MSDSSLPTPGLDTKLYLGAALTLTLLCLWPIWGIEFPPLQDYPQHLFLAHVNATYNNPAYDWPQHYLTDLTLGPYAFFYMIVAGLDHLTFITMAGRLYLTLYIGLLTGLAVLLVKQSPTNRPPWGSLLIFPLAFHQMYFMGFTNFLASVPLLAFAILDHQRFVSRPPTVWAWCRQAALVLLLFFCHPYTILVYICLAGANAILPEAGTPRRWTAFLPPAATAALFLIWYGVTQPSTPGTMRLLWWAWPETLRYYLLMFTGMRWTNGIDSSTLTVWLAAGAILVVGSIRGLKTGVPLPRRAALAFGLATAGFFALPFWAGQYSYFNLRMAPISYLFAAILAGVCCPLPRQAGLILATIAALLIGQSSTMQEAVSRETATIKPLLAAMAPNSSILPMTFQTESAILDRHFFPEAHSHDHFYYHLLVGGGVSPSLFPSPMLPLHLRPNLDLPLATHGFSWKEQGAKYDYILTRGAPAEFPPFISRYAPQISQSADWLLFKNNQGK